MQLNNTKKMVKKKTTNAEGVTVYERLPEVQLYLEASALNITKDEFYTTANERLNSVIKLSQEVEPNYVLGLAQFLSEAGIKLSPVVLLSALSNKHQSFRGYDFTSIFNTPQRVADAIALNNMGVKLNNSFKKHVLRDSLAKMSNYTLAKNQMKNRKIKTRDLIKLLKPQWEHITDVKKEELYKSIIEGTCKSPQTLVRVKSDSTLSNEDKIKYYEDNIDKISINELIRNLRFIVEETSFSQNIKLQQQLHKKLESITDFRFLNIFDLIVVATELPQLEKLLMDIVKKYCDAMKPMIDTSFTRILFDVSGSMSVQGRDRGFLYLVLFSLLYDKVDLHFFGNNLYPIDNRPIELIKKGKLKDAKSLISANDGTELVKCINNLVDQFECQNVIVISDEVSWADADEDGDLTRLVDATANKISNLHLTLINPTVSKGTVFKNNVLAFSALNPEVLRLLALNTSQQRFIEIIKEYGKSLKCEQM